MSSSIISISRRTDIPAFYSSWFMNRVREGYACVPNPFNSKQVRRVSLLPSDVACLIFITKDPRPMIPHLDELDSMGYRYCFQVTVTGLPRVWEPHVPDSADIVAAIRDISRRIGPNKVLWRFDPIIVNEVRPPEAVVGSFSSLARQLSGAVNRVIISIVRDYPQIGPRIRHLRAQAGSLPSPAETAAFASLMAPQLVEVAAENGLALQSCADIFGLVKFGIERGACIDAGYVNEVFGTDIKAGKDCGQRGECLCTKSIDIGMYGACCHGCLYCYASTDKNLLTRRHDYLSPFLLQK